MKIAIVGAGLAGVAAAWELSQHAEITLFDPLGIAGGASGVAPGLLHPYGGFWGKKSWRAEEGMAATCRLLAQVPQCLEATGILRLATCLKQATAFKKTAQYSDVTWTPEALAGLDGIVIHSGLTVCIRSYLLGLWTQCKGTLIKSRIDTLDQLETFDRIILCTGPSKTPSNDPAIKPLKGQVLRLKWPPMLTPPSRSVIGRKYLVMSRDKQSCLVGATFERDFTNLGPDPDIARSQLIPPIADLYPELATAPILACTSGLRATTPDHLPVIKQINDHTYAMRGFGSKGLLYHALFARNLAAQLGFL